MRPETSHTPTSATACVDDLTSRQRECLTLAAEGLTSAAIGDRLGVSPRTVDEHLTSACVVLGVRTRIQAVAKLVRSERPAEGRSFRPEISGGKVAGRLRKMDRVR
ncbi:MULTISPECIES: helix-turn-helix domain-containing protein [Brevundimonas]|uniref:helix-turn-helix domain-containing protein n=1 Tax=Brevundimonas TaxID=41275 RepID=UPI0009D99850|nr:helix-turn-helix transcriptional regulator [Brevundimonas diminuta]